MDISHKSSGFSLLEVLISVIVIAIGLLGVAALQMKAIEFNHSAQLRSIAISQMNSMLDRMRGNYTGVKAGYYDNISPGISAPNCTACTPTQIAQRDAYQWNQTNALLLPAGQGSIVSNGDLYTLTLRWDNNRSGATGLNCSGDASVDLTCLIMEVRL